MSSLVSRLSSTLYGTRKDGTVYCYGSFTLFWKLDFWIICPTAFAMTQKNSKSKKKKNWSRKRDTQKERFNVNTANRGIKYSSICNTSCFKTCFCWAMFSVKFALVGQREHKSKNSYPYSRSCIIMTKCRLSKVYCIIVHRNRPHPLLDSQQDLLFLTKLLKDAELLFARTNADIIFRYDKNFHCGDAVSKSPTKLTVKLWARAKLKVCRILHVY